MLDWSLDYKQMKINDDIASHWILKIVFANTNKGDFVMNES